MDSYYTIMQFGVVNQDLKRVGTYYELFSPQEFKDREHLDQLLSEKKDPEKRTLDFISQFLLLEYFRTPQYLDRAGNIFLFNVGVDALIHSQGKIEQMYSQGREPLLKLGPQGLREVSIQCAPNMGEDNARYLLTLMQRNYARIEDICLQGN